MSENYNMSAAEAEKMIRMNIENRMEEKGITRYRLQNLTGLNRTTIARWLDGETSISLGNFLKVVGALGLSLQFRPENERQVIADP